MKVKDRLLTHAEEIELTHQAQSHRLKKFREKAINEIVECNLRLVMFAAKKYARDDHATFQDLVQEGTIGLMKAIQKYDQSKGWRFSTYAMWWIRQAIQLYLYNNGRTIRTPVYVVENVGKITKARKQLTQSLGRVPSEEEIAKHLEITVEKVRHFVESTQNLASLDFMVGEDTSLGQILPDSGAVGPDEAFLNKEKTESIGLVLGNLTPREEHVIRMRFGLGVNKEHTLEEIAKVLKVTKERIRQIEAQALKKLGKGNNRRALKEYA